MSGVIGGAGSKSGVIGTTELITERGDWSPHLYCGSTLIDGYTSRTGSYYRIGEWVFLRFYWYASSVGTSGQIRVKNLPFSTQHSAANSYPFLMAGYAAHSGTDFFNAAGTVRLQHNASDELSWYGADGSHSGSGGIELHSQGWLSIA